MSDIQQVLVPDVGGDEVEVIEICVSVGDTLAADEGIVTVETDKASMDIPAPMAGELVALKVSVGDKIKEGDLIAEMRAASDEAAAPTVEAESSEEPAAQEAAVAPEQPAQEEAAQSTGGSEVIDIVVPDIGEDGEVDVIDVLVAAGDEIAQEDGLITLETDKATMDVPSSHAGIVKEVLVSTGDKVKQGSLVIRLETNSGAPAAIEQPEPEVKEESTSKVEAAPAPAVKKPAPVPHHPQSGVKTTGAIYTSPSIRRLAREFGVDLSLVKGTGNKGRILKEDVQSYVKYELSRPKPMQVLVLPVVQVVYKSSSANKSTLVSLVKLKKCH